MMMTPLAATFGALATIGLVLIIIDFAAKMNDPTPSMYNSGVSAFGWSMVILFTLLGLAASAS